jgi:hypothetical protein
MSFDENDPMEYFMNAEINLQNGIRMSPNPFLKIALEQLKNGIRVLEQQEENGGEKK